jgi:hypothetical protein
VPFWTRSPGAGPVVGLAALGAAAGFALLNPSLLPFLAAGVAAPYAIHLARRVHLSRVRGWAGLAGPVAGVVAAAATVVGVATVLLATRPSERPRDREPGPPVNPPPEVVRVVYTGDARFDDGVGWRIVDRMLVPVAAVDEAVRDDLSGGGWRVTEREGDALVYARRRRVPGGLDTWPPASTIGLSVAEVEAGGVVIRPGEGSRFILAVPDGMVRDTTPAAASQTGERLVVPVSAELGEPAARIEIDALAGWARPEPLRSLVGLSLLGVVKWLLFGFAALIANEIRNSLFDRILRRLRRSRSQRPAAPRPAS